MSALQCSSHIVVEKRRKASNLLIFIVRSTSFVKKDSISQYTTLFPLSKNINSPAELHKTITRYAMRFDFACYGDTNRWVL